MKRKQFLKGINQLSQEGAIQTFKRPNIGREEMIAGVVGVLQMDVLEYRLKTEYGVNIIRESLPFRFVRWIAETPKPVEKLRLTSTTAVGRGSRTAADVLLFENEWSIRLALRKQRGPGAGGNRRPAHRRRHGLMNPQNARLQTKGRISIEYRSRRFAKHRHYRSR